MTNFDTWLRQNWFNLINKNVLIGINEKIVQYNGKQRQVGGDFFGGIFKGKNSKRRIVRK